MPSSSSSSSSSSSTPASSSAQRPGITRSGSDVNSPRRLTRQRKLRYLSNQDLSPYVVPEKSRSSPTSPEYSTRKSRSPRGESAPSYRTSVGDWARKSSCSSSSSSSSFVAGPQGSHPLPLPEFPMINRRPDCASKDNNLFSSPAVVGSRTSTDQAGSSSSKNHRHLLLAERETYELYLTLKLRLLRKVSKRELRWVKSVLSKGQQKQYSS